MENRYTILFYVFYIFFIGIRVVSCYEEVHYQAFQRPYVKGKFSEGLLRAVSDARCGSVSVAEKEVAKKTNYGFVRGRRVVLCDGPGVNIRERPGQTKFLDVYKAIYVFLGIPYAKPPTKRNNLQFKPPEVPQKWNVVINTTHFMPACPQNMKYLEETGTTMDEDCLYLNIFAPEEMQQSKKYAVMIYIHDGNWDHGSANTFPAHMLTASQDVIVVTFNYRLGHLGFLSTGDNSSIGNYGVLDQVQAVKWVFENIHNFNGDPSMITVFGVGTGAVSAALLALSPLSRSMVKRVIAQNGAPTADWGTIVDSMFAVNTSRILGNKLGCYTESSSRLVECISKRSSNEIRMLELKPQVGWLPWGPIVDNFTNYNWQFLPEAPIDILKKGAVFHSNFAYLTGLSKDQGLLYMFEDSHLKHVQYHVTEDVFQEKIRDFMHMYNYSVNTQGVFNALTFMYKPWLDSTNTTLLRQGYINLLTDCHYNAPLHITADMLVKHGITTYMYVLNYTFEGYQLFPQFKGVTSETEYLLLSGAPFMEPKFFPPHYNLQEAKWSETDRAMSHFILQAWANFAKEGHPTPKRIFNTILWEKATKRNLLYLNLNATNTTISMLSDYKKKESEFWNCFLPLLLKKIPPTLLPTLAPGFEELRLVTSSLWGSIAGAILFLILALVYGFLYCRIRKYDSY